MYFSFHFLENGASLASEFLSSEMCQAEIDGNCTTGALQEGNMSCNTGFNMELA